MKTWTRSLIRLIVAAAALSIAYSAHADEDLVKSGTLTLKGWKVAFIGSAGQSKGELTYKGKTKKFKMTGLGFGGVGLSTSQATGVVYDMDTLDDFTGTYVSGRSGVTLGDDELLKDRTYWLTNQNGVRIQLITEKDGVELNLGADGTVIKWDD